jgi:hypothetical protein
VSIKTSRILAEPVPLEKRDQRLLLTGWPNRQVLVRVILSFLACLLLIACSPVLSPSPAVITATPSPTPTTTPTPRPNCQTLDARWGQDWPETIAVLQTLIQTNETCGAEPLTSKLYAAYMNHGAQLEASGNASQDTAIAQYQAAFQLDPTRNDAKNAVIRLNALPPPTPTSCPFALDSPADPAQGDPLLPPALFQVSGRQLLAPDESPFFVRGANYYPRSAPWHRFLTSDNPELEAEMVAELDIMAEAGLNTLRVFLWYDALFVCEPELAIPNTAVFERLDTLFALTAERNLNLIVTLNDLPDLLYRPLYTDFARYDAQTVYIVRRYRHLPHILAWDVRNEGDLDLGTGLGKFTSVQVRDWLAHITTLVREHDPHRLLTAGWLNDPGLTAPYVDILSFHHWSSADELQERLDTYNAKYDQPLLLEEFGFSSGAGEADEEQAQNLATNIAVAEMPENELAGWLIWTAFDFIPRPGLPANYQHYFGLWRTDLSPKPAVQAFDNSDS